MSKKGRIHSIETFGVLDGPGGLAISHASNRSPGDANFVTIVTHGIQSMALK